MTVNHAHGRVETRVRDAEEAHLAAVVGDVFDEPINRVPRIRALVRVLRSFLWIKGPDVDIFPFGAETPAHVLRDEDEVVPCQGPERA